MVLDRALVGALRLQRELALGLAHRLVGRPDTAAALQAGSAGLQLELAQLAPVKRRAVMGVVLTAREQLPAKHRDLAGDRDGRDLRPAAGLDAMPERAQRARGAFG